MAGQAHVLQTIKPIAETLVSSAGAASGAAVAQVWLIGPGDICGQCPRRPGCPDQSACLHLVASSGAAEAVAPDARLPLRANPVGAVPFTGAGMLARDRLAELHVAEPAWLRRAGIKSVAALPLLHGQRSLGVLVALAKSRPSEEQRLALEGAARLGAEAIGNVEAYRALAAERNRLAARNARLRAGLGLPGETEPAPAGAAPAPAGAPPAPVTVAPAPTTAPPPTTRPPQPTAAVLAGSGAMLHSDAFTLPPLRSFAQVQREAILHALERTAWKVSGPHGAAAALGLKPTTLESKMKKLGIRRPRR